MLRVLCHQDINFVSGDRKNSTRCSDYISFLLRAQNEDRRYTLDQIDWAGILLFLQRNSNLLFCALIFSESGNCQLPVLVILSIWKKVNNLPDFKQQAQVDSTNQVSRKTCEYLMNKVSWIALIYTWDRENKIKLSLFISITLEIWAFVLW